MERNTLFISHALPEDNEFVMWLAVKLRNEGYEVWCELEQVYGGEHFWKEIQEVLETRTIKVILVGSQISVKKDGVRTEWDFARELQRQHKLKDFIIPINLDGVNSNSIIGLTSLAMIQFQNSWAHGLKALIKKLEKDNVAKIKDYNPLSISHWYYNRFATTNAVLNREETFYSNWVELPELPDNLFLHEYVNETQAKQAVSQLTAEYFFPIARHERYILAFEKILPLVHIEGSYDGLFGSISIEPLTTINLVVRKIRKRTYKSDVFPTTQDASNFLVQLFQQCIHDFLLQKGLKTYEMANNKRCYFYQQVENADRKIKYIYNGKLRTKQLTGTYNNESVWHYGVSFVMKTYPFPLISFKAHLLFSDDGINIWDKKDKVLSARRKKGRRMFNAEWRDLLLCLLSSLSDDQLTFGIPISIDENLWLSTTPVTFISDKGYEDPKDEGRLAPLGSDEDEEEFIDDELYTFDSDEALSELKSDNDSEEVDEITSADKKGKTHEAS